MEASQLHLLLNYYPSIGLVIATALLVYAVVWNKDQATKSGLWLLIAIALFVFAVFETGEIAGRSQMANAGPRTDSVLRHQMSARFAFVAIEAAGILSLFGLFLLRRRSLRAPWAVGAVLVAAAASSTLAIRTTMIGRQLRTNAVVAGQEHSGGKQSY